MVTSGTSKSFAKIQLLIDDGKYYEAQQLYRTISYRYTVQKNFNEAIELLSSGIQLLATKSEATAAYDLATLLMEIFEKANYEPSIFNLGKIVQLFNCFPKDQPQGVMFLKLVLKWSMKSENSKNATEFVNLLIGSHYCNSNDYELADKYLQKSGEEGARILGNMLFPWSKKFPVSERSVMIAKIFMQLANGDQVNCAKLFLDTYLSLLESNHPEILDGSTFIDSKKVSIYKQPLLNFCVLLMLTIERSSVSSFVSLREKYKSTLQHPSLSPLLQELAEKRFNLRSETSGRDAGGIGNIFNDMLSNMFKAPNATVKKTKPAPSLISSNDNLD